MKSELHEPQTTFRIKPTVYTINLRKKSETTSALEYNQNEVGITLTLSDPVSIEMDITCFSL